MLKHAVAIIFLSLIISFSKCHAEIIDGELTIDGLKRTYHLFLPDQVDTLKKYPVVFVFHGGDGDGSSMMHFTHFNDLAEQKNFLVVYPDGYHRNWNDGRNAPAIDQSQDDVKFISTLIDDLIMHHHADARRIFATGISNGGIFCLYLAQKLSQKILAIAPVCAGIPSNEVQAFFIPHSLSIMIMNGTADPIVKYEGGPVVSEKSNRGEVISTEKMIEILLRQDGCSTEADSEAMANINLKDHCEAVKYIYHNCKDKTQFIFIKIIDGGHTWSGGVQYLPKYIIGNTCRDFNATSEIWNFFRSLPVRE